jgi:ubiquinol-cytochrome c reductase cytochrome b subunit
MIRRLVMWLDDRLGAASFAKKALRKAFPDHWAFMLGEVAMYSYVLLVLTGIFLTFFFTASGEDVVYRGPYGPLRGVRMSAAFASVLRLSFEVRAGLVMRQIHHWAADVFVAAIVAHAFRVFFTGAFRRPREINWLLGTTLLVLAMAAGFTGYSMPDDLLSGTGVRIAYSVLLSVPVVGTWAAWLFFGGEFPAPVTIGRFLALHIMLIQGLLIAVLGLHLAIVWHQKHTWFRMPGRTENTVSGSPLWPNYTMKSVGLAFAVFAVLSLLGGLVQINPVWLYGPYDPTTVSSPAQPDWYVGWLEGLLRLFPNWELHLFGRTIPEPFFPGVLIPVILLAGYALWPFLEQAVTGDRTVHHFLDRARDAPGRSGWGAGGLSFMVLLTLAGSNDVLARFFGVPVETVTNLLRAVVLIVPVLVGWAIYEACRELKARDDQAPPFHALRRDAAGGYIDSEYLTNERVE